MQLEFTKIKKKVKSKKQVKAKKKAQQSGLIAMSNDINDLQSMFDVSSLQSVKPLNRNFSAKKSRQQSTVLTSKAKKSSHGIDTSKLSRTTGNTGLTGRSNTKVSSNISSTKSNYSSSSRSGGKVRGPEELTLIFDKYKGALEAIYVRALRKDPTLEGKVVFELTISSSGKVIKCVILSSELGSKSLEHRLVSRIKSFRFPAKKVSTITVTYPIDFLPS